LHGGIGAQAIAIECGIALQLDNVAALLRGGG
jgi:hypothetical protein